MTLALTALALRHSENRDRRPLAALTLALGLVMSHHAVVVRPRERGREPGDRRRRRARDRGRALDRRARLPLPCPQAGQGGPLAAGHAGRPALLEHGGHLGRRPARRRHHQRLPPGPHLERPLGDGVRPSPPGEGRARPPAPRPRRVQQPLRGAAPEGGHRVGARTAAIPQGRRRRARDHGRDRRRDGRARERRAGANRGRDGDGGGRAHGGADRDGRPTTRRSRGWSCSATRRSWSWSTRPCRATT